MHGITKHWCERQRVQEKQQDVLADTIQKHEMTNWLNYTGWPALFRNKDIKKIAHTSWIPGHNETELKRICKLIDNLFDRYINGLRILPREIRRWLRSVKKSNPDSRPLGPLQNKTSQDWYVSYWKWFICYCLRLVEKGEQEVMAHSIRFQGDQRQQLEALWEMVRRGNEDDDGELIEKLLSISVDCLM